MRTKVEVITPQMAQEILEKHNPRNRTVSEGTVQSYATDMKNGRWTVTHQGLAFDVNGNLLDGQHRLWACLFSGVPIEFNVTRDLPVESTVGGVQIFTMDAIDRGRVRTTGQQMQLCHNIKNGNVVAAALRGIGIMCYPNVGSKRLSTANSLFLYELYGKNVEAIVEVADSKSRVSHITGPLSLFHRGEPDQALEFTKQMVTLENLSTPVRTLIKYLDKGTGRGQTEKCMRACANAILAFHEGTNPLKYQDSNKGTEYLTGMFPSITKKIREALTPCKIKVSNHKPIKP